MYRITDLEGKRFGKLTVLYKTKTVKNGSRWMCKCDCGEKKEVYGSALTHGQAISCGCISKMRYHGCRKTKLYNSWQCMKQRCNPQTGKPLYYSRGITVCEEWEDFLTFREWALTHGYEEGLTIDRIDNNKGYCPENCRWVTMQDQQNNRRNNALVTIGEKTQTVAQWCRELGVDRSHIGNKVQRLGYTNEQAVRATIKELSAWQNR